MRRGIIKSIILWLVLSGGYLTETEAEDSLKEELRELKTKLKILEERILEEKTSDSALLGFLDNIKLSGNISTSVNYNFNEPDNQTNALRIFDTEANTFQLDLLELVIEKKINRVGFRIDLDYGDVAESIGSAGLGSTNDEFDLQQAYISLDTPLGINFIIGKFVTLLGYEVIESWDNSNISRSYLFGYAIPFTHTGILGNYKFGEKLDLSLGIVNGWDNTDDNNDAKTILARAGISPSDRLALGITGIYGAEQDENNGSQRAVIDFVATFKVTDKLSLGLNYDYGHEEDAISQDQNATWSGVAGYLQYELTDKWRLAMRAEYFDDTEGARTGTAEELWEFTLTNDYRLYDGLRLRLEYRHDEATKNSFQKNAESTDTQDTISLELIYSF